MFRVRIVDQRFEHGAVARNFAHDGGKRLRCIQIHEFVDQQFGAQGPPDAVARAVFLRPRFQTVRLRFPEIWGQRLHAAIEQVDVFKHPVVKVVLRLNA